MYDANTLKILFRFSRIPVTVYTLEWAWIESFSSFFKAPETFEKDMLEKAKEAEISYIIKTISIYVDVSKRGAL